MRCNCTCKGEQVETTPVKIRWIHDHLERGFAGKLQSWHWSCTHADADESTVIHTHSSRFEPRCGFGIGHCQCSGWRYHHPGSRYICPAWRVHPAKITDHHWGWSHPDHPHCSGTNLGCLRDDQFCCFWHSAFGGIDPFVYWQPAGWRAAGEFR